MTRTLLLILGISLIALLGACGGSPSPDSDPLFFGDKRWSFDVKDNWKPVSKKCNDVEVPPKDLEAYKFDGKLSFVRISKYSEDGESVCKAGYFYNRIVSSFGWTASIYHEASVVRSFQVSGNAKKTCWKKSEGKPTGTPISDTVFDFGPEEMGLTLAATEDEIGLKLTGSPDCPGGTLQMTLHK